MKKYNNNPHRVLLSSERVFPHDPEAQERWLRDYGYLLEWWAECKFCGWYDEWNSSYEGALKAAEAHYNEYAKKPSVLEEEMISSLGLKVKILGCVENCIYNTGHDIDLICEKCKTKKQFIYWARDLGSGDSSLEHMVHIIKRSALEHLREYHIEEVKNG